MSSSTIKKILKSSGEKEQFSEQKLRRSLQRASVPRDVIDEVVTHITSSRKVKTTKELHDAVYTQLVKKKRRPLAAKYNLKRALQDLGPSGYPFEQFVGRLFAAKGYKVKTNQVVRGVCVSHEIDVMALLDDKHFVIECKFHNRGGYKSDVQTVLYMKSRFEDIKSFWESLEGEKRKHLHKVWIVTNTAFTSEAWKYGSCKGMRLMSWRKPVGHSLAELIEETELHPITALTSLTKKQKEYIITHDLVLCSEAREKKEVFIKAGLRGNKIDRVIQEAEEICGLKREGGNS